MLSILKVLQQKEPYELVLESVRVVRNLSGENWIQLPQIWTQLLQECTHLIKDILFKGDAKQNVLIAQIGLQFMNNVLNNQPTLANLIWENFSHEFRQFIYTQYRTLSFIGHIINLLTFFVLFIAKCFHMKTTKYASILHQCCTQFSRNLPVSARR